MTCEVERKRYAANCHLWENRREIGVATTHESPILLTTWENY
jgi:hypothetical protein